jgi:hypothetical protein
MAQERLILAIGRIERALSRLETVKATAGGDTELRARHEALKSEARTAIRDIDALLGQGAR